MLIRFSQWADHRLGDYLVWGTAFVAALAIWATLHFTSESK